MRWIILIVMMFAAPAAASPRDWVAAHHEPLLREFLELLAIPNVASNREDIRRNADLIVAMMSGGTCRRGC
jgi:hypothetical protein